MKDERLGVLGDLPKRVACALAAAAALSVLAACSSEGIGLPQPRGSVGGPVDGVDHGDGSDHANGIDHGTASASFESCIVNADCASGLCLDSRVERGPSGEIVTIAGECVSVCALAQQPSASTTFPVVSCTRAEVCVPQPASFGPAVAICQPRCERTTDCPAGFVCSTLGGANLGLGRVCTFAPSGTPGTPTTPSGSSGSSGGGASGTKG